MVGKKTRNLFFVPNESNRVRARWFLCIWRWWFSRKLLYCYLGWCWWGWQAGEKWLRAGHEGALKSSLALKARSNGMCNFLIPLLFAFPFTTRMVFCRLTSSSNRLGYFHLSLLPFGTESLTESTQPRLRWISSEYNRAESFSIFRLRKKKMFLIMSE